MSNYKAANWYWIVGGDDSQAYSSAVMDYVPANNPDYAAWLAAGNLATKIDTLDNLMLVLFDAGILPLKITSAAFPAINGSYSVAPISQAKINAVVTYIVVNNMFPGATSTIPWMDINDSPHIFPSVAAFKLFATAVADFVARIEFYRDSEGVGNPMPSNNVTLE